MRTHTLFRAAPLAALFAVVALPAFAVEFDSTRPAASFDDVGTLAPSIPVALDVDAGDAVPDALPPPTIPSALGDAVTPDRLDAMRGGDGNVSTTTNRADLRGNVGGNTATNVIGGGNTVADGSFGNAAGISTVIQNSGSNVLIQNSTIVNVQFVPTP